VAVHCLSQTTTGPGMAKHARLAGDSIIPSDRDGLIPIRPGIRVHKPCLFHMLIPPWAEGFHSLSAILPFLVPISPRRTKPACSTYLYCTRPVLCDQPSRLRRNFLIDRTQWSPRRIFLFSHTTQLCMSTNMAIKVPTPGTNNEKVPSTSRLLMMAWKGGGVCEPRWSAHQLSRCR